ncbi:zinc-binding dehydrogenase [Agrobacterium sp. FDAARGOS_525]|uniref:zinc-binding dehydrogenase n=1 Tax=Agrobacterium sp. FDAARGOS_525 TaxID=2420311 RepID=UPI001AECF108|nr:zinc-binding dehydrogenase [Agrobacterium sp. FDAARGOS_525]
MSDVVTLPKGIGIKDAVALLADGRTALILFRQADIKPGERVLVEAAAGGVGSLLVQLAIDCGAVVVGASGSAKKEQFVRSLGGHYVDYSAPDWGETARTVLRQKDGISAFDVVFDGVGGQVGTEASKLLRPGGRISLYGIASGSETNLSESPSIQVMGLSTAPSASETFSYIEQVLELAVSGKIRPVIGQIFPLADAALAHAAIDARTSVGKTLLISKQPSVS